MCKKMQYQLNILPSEAAAGFYKNAELRDDNAGFDLFVPEDCVFAPGERKLLSMQVKVTMNYGSLPQNYWMVPRSSISKTGLMMLNSIGVIDRSYRGELMAFLWNTTNAEVRVKKGDRLVQVVAGDMGYISRVFVVDRLPETARGEGGFGSSGK